MKQPFASLQDLLSLPGGAPRGRPLARAQREGIDRASITWVHKLQARLLGSESNAAAEELNSSERRIILSGARPLVPVGFRLERGRCPRERRQAVHRRRLPSVSADRQRVSNSVLMSR